MTVRAARAAVATAVPLALAGAAALVLRAAAGPVATARTAWAGGAGGNALAVDQLVTGVAAGACAALLGWWAVVTAVAVAARAGATATGTVTGAVGRWAEAATPALLRRALAVVLGASLAGTLGATAAHAGGGGHDRPAPATAGPAWLAQVDGDRPAPARLVVVRPGDSLWAISRRRLAAEGPAPSNADVAAAWPRWYAANRAVVGADPDLIRPGQRLRPPAPGRSR